MNRRYQDIAAARLDSDIRDVSDPQSDDFVALSRDKVPVRSFNEKDLAAVIRIDRKVTGKDRAAYYRRKAKEALDESGIRMSLVAELDGMVVGFVMARVDFGEFGKAEPAAVLDTIGVDPGFAGKGIGQALLSQLLANIATLQVDAVRSMLNWDDLALLGFLRKAGFKPAQRLVFCKTI